MGSGRGQRTLVQLCPTHSPTSPHVHFIVLLKQPSIHTMTVTSHHHVYILYTHRVVWYVLSRRTTFHLKTYITFEFTVGADWLVCRSARLCHQGGVFNSWRSGTHDLTVPLGSRPQPVRLTRHGISLTWSENG